MSERHTSLKSPDVHPSDEKPFGESPIYIVKPTGGVDERRGLSFAISSLYPNHLVVNTDEILLKIARYVETRGLQPPYPEYATGESISNLPKSQKREVIDAQNKFFREIFSEASEAFNNSNQQQPESIDLESLERLKTFTALINNLGEFITKNFFGIDENNRQRYAGSILITDLPFSFKKKPESLVKLIRASSIKEILDQINMTESILTQQKRLCHRLGNGEINTIERYPPNSWPTDPLMTHLKTTVDRYIQDRLPSLSAEGLLLDPMDLRYQILFRLTTFPLQDVFKGGDELYLYLRNFGVYRDFRRIPLVDPSVITQFGVNEALLENIFQENLVIILSRLRQNPQLQEILRLKDLFPEERWKLERSSQTGEIFVTNGEEQKAVEFREIDRGQAELYLKNLHYIHTFRCTMAFGLFLEGNKFPFSVLSLDKIDRLYKQELLTMHGYYPPDCLDLARLYTVPGGPSNTSSLFMRLVISWLRQNTNYETLLSAFMPSYANGKSMLSGGFDIPVLLKPCSHQFVSETIDGNNVYRHVTPRSLAALSATLVEDSALLETHPTFPLYPTLELMCPIRLPSLPPLPRIKNKIILHELPLPND